MLVEHLCVLPGPWLSPPAWDTCVLNFMFAGLCVVLVQDVQTNCRPFMVVQGLGLYQQNSAVCVL